MDEQSWQRLRGLRRLLHGVVDLGADLIEKHHRHTAAKPFQVLESIAPIAVPVRIVRVIHDGVLTLTYGGIHAVHHLTAAAGEWLLEVGGHPNGRR